MRKRILAVTLALMLAMLAGLSGLAACSQGAGSESGQAASSSPASASHAAGTELDDASSQAGASPAADATSAESESAQGGASPSASGSQGGTPSSASAPSQGVAPSAASDSQDDTSPAASAEQNTGSTATLEVDGQTLQVTLEANDAGRAFAELMADGPVTVDAHEFGGFEQVGDLPQPLPASDTQITTAPGDIVLYQGNQVSVFYGSNTWSYTLLGHIEGQTAEQLEALLGEGDAQLVFALA